MTRNRKTKKNEQLKKRGEFPHPALAPGSWFLLLLLREKVRKAELKEAGQYLTPALKAAKVRADAMIEAMRAEVSLDVILQSS